MEKLTRPHQPVGGQVVRLKKGEAIPEGAVLMTTYEVLERQHKTIKHFQPQSQMWPFTWGSGLLGAAAGCTGIYVNNACRTALGLMAISRMGTYVPTVVLSAGCSIVFHKLGMTNRILLGQLPCTSCAAVQSGALQLTFGAIYPMVAAPLLCITKARQYSTYYVPGLVKETAEVLPFLRRIMPSPGILVGICLAQFAIGMAFSERETTVFLQHLNPTTASLRLSEDQGEDPELLSD